MIVPYDGFFRRYRRLLVPEGDLQAPIKSALPHSTQNQHHELLYVHWR